MDTQINNQELKKKITNYLNTLIQETNVVLKSDTMKKYLEFASKFHSYSFNNSILIYLQRPNSTRLAGFCAWKQLGRYVRRGEKGVAIFAPVIRKPIPDDENSDPELLGFRITHIWDILQTEGAPVPVELPWVSPEKQNVLLEKAILFAQVKGIKVTIKNLPGNIQGLCKKGEIELDVNSGVKTVFHELAHCLTHFSSGCNLTRAEKEVEAEATAFSVAKYFGVGNLQSPNYVALCGLSDEQLKIRMKNLHTTIAEIITGIEGIKKCEM